VLFEISRTPLYASVVRGRLLPLECAIIMLRRTPQGGGNTGSATSLDSGDAGEKGGKIRRQERSQLLNGLVFLGIMSVVFLVAIVKSRHNRNSPFSNRLRSSGDRRLPREVSEGGGNAGQQQLEIMPPDNNQLFLPPHSIYKLSIPDATDQLISLEKFAGLVTLVVNVACL
jgi:hypothetical protein